MSNSAHSHAMRTFNNRYTRKRSKLGYSITVERLDEILGKREPVPEALKDPVRVKGHKLHGPLRVKKEVQ